MTVGGMNVREALHIKINLQSLEDTQIGYILQKYTLDRKMDSLQNLIASWYILDEHV